MGDSFGNDLRLPRLIEVAVAGDVVYMGARVMGKSIEVAVADDEVYMGAVVMGKSIRESES